MSDNNLRQADVPEGATVIPQSGGTAPGLICPVGNKVVYAVPGVPYEMAEMFDRAILPDLRARMAEAGEEGVIASRVLRTWGASESGLAEALQGRIDVLDATGGDVTLAFLASGIEGIKVRITARAAHARRRDGAARQGGGGGAPRHRRAPRRHRLRRRRRVHGGRRRGRLIARGLTFGVAESLTGGLIASRLVNVPGASAWFRGGVVAYHSEVKFDVLGVPEGPVVTEAAAAAMAEGAARVTGADVGLGITGVAGPDEQEGVAPGTVFVGLSPARAAHPDPRAAGPRGPGARAPTAGPFRPSTCFDAPSTPTTPEPPRSQEAHSGATLDGESGRDPVSAGRYDK